MDAPSMDGVEPGEGTQTRYMPPGGCWTPDRASRHRTTFHPV